MKTPLVVLVVLDGWGLAPPSPGNAISQAKTPNMQRLWALYPHTQLAAAGEGVGLPRGEAGNTETGHLNLGAGRIVYQDLLRINMAVANGTFFKNKAFLGAIEHARKNKSNLHLMGLVGAGGVHSNIDHLYALLRLSKENDFTRVFVHVFTDGRDSPPNAAISYISQLEDFMEKNKIGQIASVMGRYWAMDRDYRWERTEVSYKALTTGTGVFVSRAVEAIEKSYEKNVTDEFINPAIVVKNSLPLGIIKENDSCIFFNFRIDRPRQLTKAFVIPRFEEEAQKDWGFDPYMPKYHKTHLFEVPRVKTFKRGPKIKNLYFATMTEYGKPLDSYVSVAFPPEVVKQPLGQVLADQGKRQLRLAESEKERFVTFYFNGQREIPFLGEERLIIPSLAVSTYDQAPEMSARGITKASLENLGSFDNSKYSFILINFANADMVGHTGNLKAAIEGCGVVDECVGDIERVVTGLGGVTIITGDHGNAEQMLGGEGGMHTEHTTNPVPFIVAGEIFLGRSEVLQSGILADVAPTVLKLLDIPVPAEMTGRPLI
ncbi:MAG: 2,3-bisphosphoglycerate-independent phosphoglycerate mutase [Candidatus Blackburnbacteria bacterium]|nr:2,3-bisphosphoglycerate-independent phosphoglycerate mutase [Candidatus Blackburnbacteria bacterium]